MVTKDLIVYLQNNRYYKASQYKAFSKIIEFEIFNSVANSDKKLIKIEYEKLMLKYSNLYFARTKYEKWMDKIAEELRANGFIVTKVNYDRKEHRKPEYFICWG